jgi:hypothetical protein
MPGDAADGRRRGARPAARRQPGHQFLAGPLRHWRYPRARRALSHATAAFADPSGERHIGGQRVDRDGVYQLVERRVVGGWRAQRNRRNGLETPVELVARNTVAPRDSLNLLTEQLNVEPGGFPSHHVGIDLPGDGVQHTLAELFLQIGGQSQRGWIRPFPDAQLVPGDFDRQPLLRPVTGEPRNEVRLDAPGDAASPTLHEAARVVGGRPGRGPRRADDVAIDLPPDSLRDLHRRSRLRGALRTGASCQQHHHQQADDAQAQLEVAIRIGTLPQDVVPSEFDRPGSATIASEPSTTRRGRVEALIGFGSSKTGTAESIGSPARRRQSRLCRARRQVEEACDLRRARSLRQALAPIRLPAVEPETPRAPCRLATDRFAGQLGGRVGITARGDHQAFADEGPGKRRLVRGESGVY